MRSPNLIPTIPDDVFGRTQIAQDMCSLIKNMDCADASPFVIDAPWGAGKSVHAARMISVFEEDYGETHKCIYWNAAYYDYSENPLLIFIAQLYAHTPNNRREDFVKKTSKMGMITKGTASLLNQCIENNLGINLKEIITDAKGENNKNASNEDLTIRMAEILECVTQEESHIQTAKSLIDIVREDKELIIFIDELDRCKPLFALTLMEKIKHLFEQANCKFILVANTKALAATVKHIYGFDDESAKRYLGKYTKTNLILPNFPTRWDGKSDCKSIYFFNLLAASNIQINTYDNYLSFFTEFLFNKKCLELREIEKLVKRIQQTYAATKKSPYHHPSSYYFLFLCIAAYLIEFSPNEAVALYTNNTTATKVLEELGFDGSETFKDSNVRQQSIKIKNVINFHFTPVQNRNAFLNDKAEMSGIYDFHVHFLHCLITALFITNSQS